MKIFVSIAGSLRKDSFNKLIAQSLEQFSTQEYTIKFKSIENIPFFNEDLEQDSIPTSVIDLSKEISESSGLIICTPEYNGSYSGVIKNTLDWLSRDSVGNPLREKPVLAISASVNQYGGSVANADLRRLTGYLGMYAVNFPRIRISKVQEIFDESRNISSEGILKQLHDGVKKLFELSSRLSSTT